MRQTLTYLKEDNSEEGVWNSNKAWGLKHQSKLKTEGADTKMTRMERVCDYNESNKKG
jgi:hypothetical protein